MTLADLARQPTIYLVSACDDPEDEQVCLHAVFSTLFDDQLDGWLAGSDDLAHASFPGRLQALV